MTDQEKRDFAIECNRRRECGLLLFTGTRTRFRTTEDNAMRNEFGGYFDKYRNGYLFENWECFFQAAAYLYPEAATTLLRVTNNPIPEPVSVTPKDYQDVEETRALVHSMVPPTHGMGNDTPDQRPVPRTQPVPTDHSSDRSPGQHSVPDEVASPSLTGHRCLVCREQITETNQSDLPSFCRSCSDMMRPGVR